MEILDVFKRQINRPTLVFPQIITDSEVMKRFDRALMNRQPYIMSILYKQYANDEGIKLAENQINAGLDEPRNLNPEDIELINNVVKAYKKTNNNYIIFNSIGNLMFISDVIDHLGKSEETPEIIRITCFLWLYQNIFELTVSHISEIFSLIAKHNKDENFTNEFNKSIEKETHLTVGRLLDFAKKREYKFTHDKKNTFLHNNELRNRLAHANCFYDSVRKEIILTSNKTLTIEEFNNEFLKIKDFLFELIYQLNNQSHIKFTTEMINLAKEYFKLSRNTQKTKFFKTEFKF